MAFLERLRRWLSVDDTVREMTALQALRPANATFSGESYQPVNMVIAQSLLQGNGRVSRDRALSVPAVQRGRNLICSIATLPLVQLDALNNVRRLPLLEEIDPDVTNVVTLSQTLEDLLFEGISWWRITQRGFDNFPTYARHLTYSSVTIQPPVSDPRAGRTPSPLPAGYDPRDGVIYVDGVETDPRDLIRFDSPNPALLVSAGRLIRRAIALDDAAELYTKNPRPLDYFTENPDAPDYDDDERRSTLDNWQSARQTNSTAWVPRALLYNPVDSPNPRDLQLVELQERVNRDIANALGLDPEDLGINTTSRTYQNVTDRRRDRINDVLAPYMKAITDTLSKGNVTKRGYRVDFQLDDYLKADPITRTTYYTSMKALGAITVDEIREEEDLPQLPADAQPEPQQPPAPNTQQTQQTNVVAIRKTRMAFGPAKQTFELDIPVVGFKVDREQRTIEGLALPYNEVARKFGMKFRFAPGALQLSETSRNKLLRDHDIAQAIGVLASTDDRANGVFVRYKVARGPEGDQALSLAEDGVLDGFSVGVEFDQAGDTVPDPNDKEVTLIRRADWLETSLTAMPAFDGARVTKVAASRDGGSTVDTTTTEPTPVPAAPAVAPAPASAQFTTEQLGALMQQMLASGQISLPSGSVPTPKPEGPTFVNPVRALPAAQVNEALPYRFDRRGNLTCGPQYDFSGDIISGLRDGDGESYQRALRFAQARFITQTTDVNELNPSIQRPDMYVDNLDRTYPLWSVVSKGPLPTGANGKVTPFVYPKFNTSSGMVAAHSEGVEPSRGTFTTTDGTVTPSALSGKVSITREAWDQGGNPQLSGLIWREMLRSWYEGLEQAVVTLLDAESPTQYIVCGAGSPLGTGAGIGLDDNLDYILSGFQFERGGDRFDSFFTNSTLHRKLVGLRDADGRPMYPQLGPTNSGGMTTRRYRAVDVGGFIAVGAWALDTTPSNSYVFASEDVSGWASAPQRFEFAGTNAAGNYAPVAMIDVSIWGYKALTVTRSSGVRELIVNC